MSSYSHFQFKIYLRRSLTLSLWCLMLTGFKPHPLHPLPSRTGPTSEGAGNSGQSLLPSNSRALPPYTPACRPASQPQWHPKPGSFPHSLKPFQTRWEAACSPRASVIWVMKPSDSPPGSWGAQPSAPTRKASLRREGSLLCREAQNLHCWFHIYILFS